MEELLKKLVEINSIFPNEKDIGNFLYTALEKRGFVVEKQKVAEGRFNILGKKGNGNRKIGFYAHMDTVPVQGNWQADPFSLRIEDEKAIGLGAYDMKAGIVAILKAVERTSNCELRVGFGVDEENNSLGAHKISERKFFEGCDLVIVPEINDSPIQKEEAIMLGRRGRVRYEIEVYGQSCHGASGGGINAINEASKVIQAIEKMKISLGQQMKGSHYINSIYARAKSVSYPDKCILELDVHLVAGENENSVLEKIKKTVEKTNVNLRVKIQKREVPYLMPYWTKANIPEVIKFSSLVRKEYGNIEYTYGKSVADECIIAKMAPVISFASLGGNFHREEEWVDLKSLERVNKIFTMFIE